MMVRSSINVGVNSLFGNIINGNGKSDIAIRSMSDLMRPTDASDMTKMLASS